MKLSFLLSISRKLRGKPISVQQTIAPAALPTTDETLVALDIRNMLPFGNYGYSIQLSLAAPEGDSMDNPTHSLYVLLEDGIELQPAHCGHEFISAEGKGAYSHWLNTLYFSTSDNSDPRKNGRTYALKRIFLKRWNSFTSIENEIMRARKSFFSKIEPEAFPHNNVRIDSLCRLLPYPYNNALSIASDVDGMTVTLAEAIHTTLENEFGLNLGDSYWPFGNLSCEPKDACIFFENAAGKTRQLSPKIIAMYHRGWFDSIHSWDDDFIEPSPLVVNARITVEDAIAQDIALKIPDCMLPHVGHYGLTLDYSIDPGITKAELSLIDSHSRTHTVVLKGDLDNRPGWDNENMPGGSLLLFAQESHRKETDRLDAPDVFIRTIRFSAAGTGICAIHKIGPLAFHRKVVEQQLPILQKFGMVPHVLYSHGGKQFISTITPAGGEAATITGEKIPVGEADLPSSSAYHFDLLHAAGIRYIWPARPPYRKEDHRFPHNAALSPIQDFVRPYLHRDGIQTYLVPRYVTLPDPAHPYYCQNAQYHHNENTGYQLATVLRLCLKDTGKCAIVFIHWGAVDSMPRPEVRVFNDETREILLILTDLQNNISGNNSTRLWITPSSVLSRYATMIQQLPRQVSVQGNTVSINAWTDPITQDVFDRQSFLHGATIYVPDPENASIILDGMPFDIFLRNPPDETGQPSVTIIDDSSTIVLHGRVNFWEQAGYIEQIGGTYTFDPAECAGTVTVNGLPCGSIRYYPDELYLHDSRYLTFSYLKSNKHVSFGIMLHFNNGDVAAWEEKGDRSNGTYPGASMPQRSPHAWHTCTFDMRNLSQDLDNKRPLLRGRIKTLEIRLSGCNSPTEFVRFKNISLLAERANGSSKNVVILGGSVTPHAPGYTVKLVPDFADETISVTDKEGMFFFADVPRGSVVEIYAEHEGHRYYPHDLRKHEVRKNNCDINITINNT